jgi:putative MATE family efflux protein
MPSLRRIAALAVPALVVLAAEPIYVLVDTAVVGHLPGRTPLAALSVSGAIMSFTAWLGGVVAYGTTGRAARFFGAGRRADAVAEGVQASWLALAAGVVIWLFLEVVAGPFTRLIAGDHPDVARAAAGWLRIAACGAPGLLLGTAGNGWMRGVQDTRRPLVYVVGANLLSAVLCPLLVYPAHLGLTGSAIANASAQSVAGLLFARALVVERVSLRPRLAVIVRQLVLGRDLLIRGAAFQACFLSASAVAARFGEAALAAHQIALQLWLFCALALDAVAIAAQALVGAALGGARAGEARRLGRRIATIGGVCGTGVGILVVAAAPLLRPVFGVDAGVYDQAMRAWWWFAGMQPFAGVVFALDGVFIGAGDAVYLRNSTIFSALFGFLPMIWLSLWLKLGLGGVWVGLTLFVLFRLAALLARLRGDRWLVTGTH